MLSTKPYTLCDYIYVKGPEKANLQKQNRLVGARGEGWEVTACVHQGSLWIVMEMF